VSEKSTTQQQAGSSEGQKRAAGPPLISLGPALVGNWWCLGKEKRMMRESQTEIGNSGLNCPILFRTDWVGI
jgi:hypothetical protein